MRLRKFDNELQIVYGEVYAPGVPDAQGHFMRRDTVRVMAHNYLTSMRTHSVNLEHGSGKVDAAVVESFIARDGDPDFIAHAWVIGMHIPDLELWAKVKSHEINGFSLQGIGFTETKTIELEIPEELVVQTEPGPDGHTHGLTLRFDEQGDLQPARTDAAQDGHWHLVSKGTVTETPNGDLDGHTHRFSFVEQLLDAQPQDT